MAGDWIKMRTGLLDHPKVVSLSSALKADRKRVVGALYAAWCIFDEHTVDGLLVGYTTQAMDDSLGWRGFGAGMVAVGWLIVEPEGLRMPRFDSHNGVSAKRRAQDADRKRTERGQMSASQADGKADTKRTREEKRREEAITSEAKASSVPGFDLVAPTPENLPPVTNGDSPTRETWAAYSGAYTQRWKVAPPSSARANGQLAQFVKLVPASEAPEIAAFYVQSDERFYTLKKHPLELLLKDAAKLRTEWATRRHGTETEAGQRDRTAATGNVFRNLIEDFHGTDKSAA